MRDGPGAGRLGRGHRHLGIDDDAVERHRDPDAPTAASTVGNSTGDIGTGTYTILTQIAADTLGLPMDAVTTKLGDTRLPEAPVAGGSWTAASSGTAVMKACRNVGEQVFKLARAMENSPLANVDVDRAVFADGRIAVAGDPGRSVSLVEVLQAARIDKVEAVEQAGPDKDFNQKYEAYTHSAIFVEVKVDEELGQVRVTRVVSAIAAGKILNPKTARSQILGGVVMGIGSALEEESMLDHRIGRFMNHNLGEYHVPVNADIYDIDVIFVDEEDKAQPAGREGPGRDRHRRRGGGDHQRRLPRHRKAGARPADHYRQVAVRHACFTGNIDDLARIRSKASRRARSAAAPLHRGPARIARSIRTPSHAATRSRTA